MIVLEAGSVRLDLAPEHGGRIDQLTIAGTPVLVPRAPGDGPMSGGSFPMIPYVGRIRRGVMVFEGTTYGLPVTLAPHAIHGTTYLQEWSVVSITEHSAALRCELGPDWPFGGWAEQRFELSEDRLVCTMSVHAADLAMPAQVGWHPWFVKPDGFEFVADAMLLRDADGIPDGTEVPVPPGPWDDTFVGIHQPVVLRWGALRLAIESDGSHWVVYDQPIDATCVEPQSGPPDAPNWLPEVLAPHESLTRTMTWTWRHD